MKKPILPPLSASEQAIMDQLWRGAPLSLNELLDAVNAEREDSITRATLQTQLTRLEAKGWIVRDDSFRAHQYRPAVRENPGRKSVLTEIRRRLFGGSNLALVKCLVEGGDFSAEELRDLQELIHSASNQKGSKKA